MKKIFIILLALFIAMSSTAQNDSAYIPQAISYQAIAKDTAGTPVSNATVALRASILRDTINGTLEWEETHSATTDESGLFEIMIGSGTRTAGEKETFAEIDWGSAKHFLKMEIDITGGSNFSDASAMQFCAIPYAFKTTVADSLSGISMDTLRLMTADGLGCPCSLQDAYNNGEDIQVTLNNPSDVRSVFLTNLFPSGTTVPALIPILDVYREHDADNTLAMAAQFWSPGTNPNIFDDGPTVWIENDLHGNPLQISNGNVPFPPTVQSVSSGIVVNNYTDGPAVHFDQQWLNAYGPSTEPTILSWNKGLGDGGLFQLMDPTNSLTTTASAIRAEILPGDDILQGQAGSFVTFEPNIPITNRFPKNSV